MKFTKRLLTPALLAGFAVGTLIVRADNKHQDHAPKVKAYPLAKCVVSDDKLGEHGKPYVFLQKGQEINLEKQEVVVWYHPAKTSRSAVLETLKLHHFAVEEAR